MSSIRKRFLKAKERNRDPKGDVLLECKEFRQHVIAGDLVLIRFSRRVSENPFDLIYCGTLKCIAEEEEHDSDRGEHEEMEGRKHAQHQFFEHVQDVEQEECIKECERNSGNDRCQV